MSNKTSRPSSPSSPKKDPVYEMGKTLGEATREGSITPERTKEIIKEKYEELDPVGRKLFRTGYSEGSE